MSESHTAALLCSGPSLADFLDGTRCDDAYRTVIGVNRAAIAYPCDWWAFHDAEAFLAFTPRGQPKIATTAQSYSRFCDHPPADVKARVGAFEWFLIERMTPTLPRALRWDRFSITAGLALAYGLGVDHVDVYGADMAGVTDWDNRQPDSANRTDTRWKSERARFGLMTDWLATHGVTVSRILKGQQMGSGPQTNNPSGPVPPKAGEQPASGPAAPKAKPAKLGDPIALVARRSIEIGGRVLQQGDPVGRLQLVQDPALSVNWLGRALYDNVVGVQK